MANLADRLYRRGGVWATGSGTHHWEDFITATDDEATDAELCG